MLTQRVIPGADECESCRGAGWIDQPNHPYVPVRVICAECDGYGYCWQVEQDELPFP